MTVMQAGTVVAEPAEPPFKPKRSSKKAARTKSPPTSPPFKQEYPQYYDGHVPAASDFGGHFFNGYHHGGHHGHFAQQQSGYPYYHHHHHYQVPYPQQQLYDRYHDADDYRSASWEDKRSEDDSYGLQHYGKPSVDDVGNPTSVNTRILELRKEKSRDAARSRRNKENTEFYELAKMLPLPGAITTQLDKASIIRLTISYLKLRDFSGHGEPPWSRDPPPAKNAKGPMRSRAGMAMDLFEQHQGTHILQSLDGFAFSLGADGRFLYISETVSIYLGLSQVEMTGSSVFDYVHHADHQEVAEQLGLGLAPQGGQGLASPASAGSEEGIASNTGTMNPDVATQMALSTTTGYKGLERSFCVRMKSTLTKRGCHFKSSGYRVVLVLCRLRPQCSFSHSRKATPPLLGMVAIAIALPPPSVHEIRLDSDMFVTRINFDFRIAHCEPRVSELLDYTAEELTGKNLYTLCHGEDANRLRKCHLDLINKGQVLTHYYRLMNKNGGFTWLQTCATVVCSSKNAEETNIICVNYVISAREYGNLILDTCQMEDSIQTVKREDNSNDPENGSPDADRGEGHSSGGPSNQRDTHRSPPDLDDGSSEAPGDHRGGRHHDHVTQLQPLQPLHRPGQQPGLNKKLQQRRGSKRKMSSMAEDDSSLCTSDEDDDEDGPSRTKQPHLQQLQGVGRGAGVLSPASSSCHSTGMTADASPKTSAPTPSTPVTASATVTSAASAVNHHPADDGGDAAPTSVKDLEHAMSKHLPAVSLSKCSSPPLLSLQPHGTTDFSADTLLKQQQQRSTIQWIGAHHHLNHHLNHQQLPHSSAAPLPATALLRQLYANRESVIRANVHAGGPTPGLGGRAGSVGPGGGGGASYYTGDVSHVGPLPTPPGSEGSYGDHQFLLHNNKGGASATADAFNSLVSSYSATGGYSVDYHSAMTPPSSVSPRDKHQHQQLNAAGVAAGAFDSAAYSDVLRHQYGGMDGSPAQPLPLKPQAYHSTLDAATAAAYAASTGTLDQSQFYHQGFHLYHPKQAAGPATSWYSAPS
ncbi:protein trachealess isoform X2 [Thrips palmi]|uniref:Protein trachealess isoform X2 n=1 Tax=Thrips palmi TaxID=161013 RepID=A0A6P9A6C3_THRPL|nr:protein trachealess isoform X2 [Thrips palmi]